MGEEGKKRVRKAIDKAAKNLAGKLPQKASHPQGRNPHAHIAKVIISVFGKSYTELPDSDIDMVLEIVSYCEKYPF